MEQVKKKLLIVEDDAALVEVLKERLEANNYEVTVACDGVEGLDKAKRERPDLIILDLMLPKLDGYKVCSLLKKDISYSKIPILMLTARTLELDRQVGTAAGADAYLTKPYDPQALLEKVQELLAKK